MWSPCGCLVRTQCPEPNIAQALVPLLGVVTPDCPFCIGTGRLGTLSLRSPFCGEDGGARTSQEAWIPLQDPWIPPFPSGLESVDHYPILVAVTGILVRLLVHGPASG